jgi:hypothetical protein
LNTSNDTVKNLPLDNSFAILQELESFTEGEVIRGDLSGGVELAQPATQSRSAIPKLTAAPDNHGHGRSAKALTTGNSHMKSQAPGWLFSPKPTSDLDKQADISGRQVFPRVSLVSPPITLDPVVEVPIATHQPITTSYDSLTIDKLPSNQIKVVTPTSPNPSVAALKGVQILSKH